MPVPFAPWRDDAEQAEAEGDDARGPIFFDPSLNMSEAWRPPRPPRQATEREGKALDRAARASET
jgi:hypothetical protein